MKVSAIIPSLWDVDKEYTKLCIESLRETTKSDLDNQWDIILVTNGSGDEVKLKKDDIKGVTIHLNTKTQGQCNAVNMGADVADGGYFFIVNSDMYFSPNWFKNINFKYKVFSPNLIEPTNNAGSAEPFIKFDGGNSLEEFNREDTDVFVNAMMDGARVAENPRLEEPGFNLPFFIRQDVWRLLKGYDKNYDPWGSNSDTDLQTRLNLAGITPMRLRDVLVYHFSNKSGTFDGTHQDFYQNNLDYFKSKFGFDRDELGSDVWRNKDMLPEDKSKIKFKADWIGKYE